MFQPDAARNAMLNSLKNLEGDASSSPFLFCRAPGIRRRGKEVLSVGKQAQRGEQTPYRQDAYATLSLSNKFQIDIFELRNLPLKIELFPDHRGALLADRASQVSIGGKPEE